MSSEAVISATATEGPFDGFRRRAGFVLGPLAFAAVWFADLGELPESAHRMASVMAAVIVLWVCETLPMAVTALLGAAVCVILQIAPANKVFAPFADQLMFLFIGSFILARAIFLNGLDRRVALTVLSREWVGARPGRVLFAFGAVTAAASAWVSNTAITAMMFAIGLSILRYMLDDNKGDDNQCEADVVSRSPDRVTPADRRSPSTLEQLRPAVDEGAAVGRPPHNTGRPPHNTRAGKPRIDLRFATGMMLMTAFSASIGGLATPVGTPPNVIGIRAIQTQIGVDFPFFSWCLLGVPVVAVLYLFMFAYLNWLCPAGVKELPGSRELLVAEREKLGPWTPGERSTVIAFLVTVALWLAPGVVQLFFGENDPTYQMLRASLPEAVGAILGASLLFLLPGNRGHKAITWREAVQIDWGVVLIYGGGVAFGVLALDTGLTDAMGEVFRQRLDGMGPLAMLFAATAFAALMSEATSNTASATVVVPMVIAVAQGLGVDPLPPAIAATMGCSLGFMLPVSTPCNAIVYGSGYIPITRMIRYGLLLDIAGVAVIVGMVWFLLPLIRPD
jgi:sodium-dependent dicarboxylate transporter 2/3/5